MMIWMPFRVPTLQLEDEINYVLNILSHKMQILK